MSGPITSREQRRKQLGDAAQLPDIPGAQHAAFAEWWKERKITGDWDAWAVKDLAVRAFQAGWEMRGGDEPVVD